MDPHARIKMMLQKLKEQVANGSIDNEWVEKFIIEMNEKAKLDYYPFSEKQLSKIEELFEQY